MWAAQLRWEREGVVGELVADNVAEKYEAVGPGREAALLVEHKGVTSG